MHSLQELKTRLTSVATTKKITKAMHLVATSKLRKAKSNLSGIQEYYQSVYETFKKLLASIDDFEKLLPQTKNKPTLFIIITSDLGLCGSYNSNIYKLAKEHVKHTDKLIVLGSKGVSHFKIKKFNLDLAIEHVGDNPNYTLASQLGNKAIAEYKTNQVSAIKVIHTKFINSVTFESEVLQVLPIVSPKNKLDKAFSAEFEPDPETVVKNAIPLYMSAIIYGSLVESKVSEMSSRRTAMENATDNANELIDKLDLEYNRARQSSITQEITEIVAGTME